MSGGGEGGKQRCEGGNRGRDKKTRILLSQRSPLN